MELQIPADAMPAEATTTVEAVFNLDATADVPTVTPFDSTDPDTYSYANTATVFDSLGVQHTMTMYFVKTADNQWDVHVAVDGNIDNVNTGQLVFDSNGILDTAASTFPTYNVANVPGNGAADLNFAIDFDGTTQFGNDFSLASMSQDGYTSGSLIGISFDESGNIIGNYANEQSLVLGTVALATFRNMEGLSPVGDNAWVETTDSGEPLLGLAGTGQFGTLLTGVLEASNVDLTQELVDLIVAQRNYQANTQTIKVQDEILQSTVNLR